MPRLRHQVPKYRKHRVSGQAVVTIAGRDHYLGPHGTKASKLLYDRLIAEYLAADRQPFPSGNEHRGPAVVEILAAYWKHCKAYYIKNGKPTNEQAAFRIIIRDIRKLYGDQPAIEFGPLALKAVREVWIERVQSTGPRPTRPSIMVSQEESCTSAPRPRRSWPHTCYADQRIIASLPRKP